MYCIHCGAQNLDQARFCALCGQAMRDLSGAPSPAAADQVRDRPYLAKPARRSPLRLKLAGGLILLIAATGAYLAYARFFSSPGKIAFVSNRHNPEDDEDLEIFVMDDDGSNVQRVTTESERALLPAWSPGTERIAYITLGGSLNVISPNGSAPFNLAQNVDAQGSWLRSFDWSPDGRKIAFSSQGQFMVINSDGTGLAALGPGSYPRWSPDGRWIVVVSEQFPNDEGSEIYLTDPDGGNRVRLTDNSEIDFPLSWSPDSERIAYFSGSEESGTDIYIMNADGSQRRSISQTDENEFALFARWSPDGRMIAYVSISESDNRSAIIVVRQDGSLVTSLDNTPSEFITLSWSRDSKNLLIVDGRDDPDPENCRGDCNLEIYKMAVDGGQITRLTQSLGLDASPVWSP